MLYFSQAAASPENTEEAEQMRLLAEFKAELLGAVNPLVWSYHGLQKFHETVRDHLLASVASAAQHTSAGVHTPLKFSIATQHVLVRSEGKTELLGEILLKCRCSPDFRGPELLWFSTTLFLNTAVTSRISAAEPGKAALSEAIIHEVGRPGVGEVHHGVVLGNSVVFGQIYLTDIQPAEERTFRITNIRCNASAVAGKIIAAVGLGGLPIEQATAEVAVTARELRFEVARKDGGSHWISSSAKELRVTGAAHLRFHESFPHAFKARNASGATVLRTVTEGPIFVSESNPMTVSVPVPGTALIAGEADYGTRFRAVFLDIPAGTRLFVSSRSVPIRKDLSARLIESASTVVPRAQHHLYQIDWGLAVDFWICLACYGLVRLIR
jgi:hypothetical protein